MAGSGNDYGMDERAEREWQDAVAIVERELDDEALEEAHEVYLAEAARTRLRDREGWVRVALRHGAEVGGELGSHDPIAEHLVIVDAGRTQVIAERAIVAVSGSQTRLRGEGEPGVFEGGRSLASWLREVWIEGRRVEAMTVTGSRWTGSLTFVGADHIELSGSDRAPVVVPFMAVDVWSVLG